MVVIFHARTASLSSPKSEKLVLYILLLTTVVIGLQKPYTKIEVGADLVMDYVYLKTLNVDVQCRIKYLEYISRIRNTVMRIL